MRALPALLLSAALLPYAPSAQANAPGRWQLIFQDSFENADRFLDLFEKNGRRWTHFQRTIESNEIEVVSRGARRGTNALRLLAVPSGKTVSKADVERALPLLKEGDTLIIQAWMFLPRGPSLEDVFLLDLECGSCWPTFALVSNKSPGIRIQLKGDVGYPLVERGKIGLSNYRHNGAGPIRPVPRGVWTRMRFYARLASNETGLVRVEFDDRVVFSSNGPNLPDPRLFIRYGIFLKHTGYDRFQIGVTANGSRNPVEMMLDTVSVRLKRRPL